MTTQRTCLARVLALAAAALALSSAPACLHPHDSAHTVHAGPARAVELPCTFDVLSWNAHKQRHPDFEAELARFTAGVELLALQEALDSPPIWGSSPVRRWTLVVAFEIGSDQVAAGVANGSVAPPTREQALLSPTAEPLTRTRKSMLLSWLAIEGASEPLLLVNLHAINFRPAEALADQLRALDPFLDAHTGPTLVVGDFNTWSRGRRAVVADFVARHGLTSVFSPEATPPLDGIYVRGLVAREAETLASRSSDHDALRVRVDACGPPHS